MRKHFYRARQDSYRRDRGSSRLTMSRNKEKAQSALNRFQAYKNKEAGILESNPNLRPKYVQSVTSLPQAEKWRSTILSEISVKLTRIQDSSINDFQIRDINDDLNNLFKEKRAWEYHIKSLGGNDYINFGGNNMNQMGITDSSGLQVKGYRYFGRAKELPDVKQALEAQKKVRNDKNSVRKAQDEEAKVSKQRLDRIDLSYYGWYDERSVNQRESVIPDEEVLLINSIAKNMGEDFQIGVEDHQPTNGFDPLLDFEAKQGASILKTLQKQSRSDPNPDETIYDFEVEIPSNDQVSHWIVEKRKKVLLAKLGLDRLQDV